MKKNLILLVVLGISVASSAMAGELGQVSMSRVSAGASFCGNSSKDKALPSTSSSSSTSKAETSRSHSAR